MSNPYPPFGSQNLQDDDAQVLDDLVQPTSAPADIKAAVEPVTPPPKVEPRAVTRLLANTYTMSGGGFPQPLLREDPDRLNCHVKVYSTAATPGYNDYVIVSDDKGNISGGAIGINIVGHHGQTIDLDGHTGALWAVQGSGISASIEVTAYAVTVMPGVKVEGV